MTQEELLEGLTGSQAEAVTHVDGPLLIVAAAGSGKTRVITRRVAYLISMGIPQNSILAITFTNKAAGEMKQRVGDALGKQLRDWGRLDQYGPTICTFHSLCLRVLKHYAGRIGLPAGFTIYDSGDQNRVIKDALKTLEISATNFSPNSVHAAISNAKNKLLSPEAFSRGAGDFYQRQVSRIYSKYQQLLQQSNAMDFDDLLLKCAEVFRDYPDVLSELQEKFKYIMIDEYQDTNHAQYVIAHALALRHKNICVVGDPDQSIYAWRGADIQNILDFEKDYPDAKVVRLEQNYRSTKRILAIAGQLIQNNIHRKDKRLFTENPEGAKAKVVLCQDEHDEARVVAEELRKLNEEGLPWNEMAIFYRMNALSRVMEDELRRRGMPYVMARGVEFYNRKEIKDVLAYLRVISNPLDEVNLTRIVNVPTRGIGDSSVKVMQTWAVGNGTTLWGAMENVGSIEGLSTRAVNAVQSFVRLVDHWRSQAMNSRIKPIMEDVVKRSGLEAFYQKERAANPTSETDALANVNELISSAAEYDEEFPEGVLDEYLSNVSLVSDADHMEGNGGAITMMTLHAAKGLEFPVVAMIGMEEGILPHARARGNMDELEEERRLCFVGITRAEQRLIMTRAAYRTIRGLRERTVTSPFLREMPEEELEVIDRSEMEDRSYGASRGGYAAMPSSGERNSSGFRRGQRVRHPQFGIGTIADISEMGQHTRAVIEFGSAGRKTLILQYARLEPA